MSLPPPVRQLHALGITGKGVTIGHLDTGIDPGAGQIPLSAVREFRVFDELGRPTVTEPKDAEGHGTVTASVLHQVAPEAAILSAVVFDGGFVYARILAAMSWLFQRSADIVLMSFGVPCRTSLFERMVQALTHHNALCVVASGNQGTGKMFSPAWSSHALTVGAFDEVSGLPAVYSSCIELDGGARRKPEVLAPGSVGNESGTSVASAFVAGLACLVRQAKPGATPEALKQAFAASCSPLSSMAYKAEHGLVEAQKIADLCEGKLDVAWPLSTSHACSRLVLPRDEGLRDRMALQPEEGHTKILVFLREGAGAAAFQRRVAERWPVIWIIEEQGIVFCEVAAPGINELSEDEDVEAIYFAKP